jgi:hypothetical protein
MKKLSLISIGLTFLLVSALLGPAQASYAATGVRCSNTATLRQTVQQSTSAPLCYQFSVTSTSSFLRLEFESSSGTFDLYLGSGSTTFLSASDQINASPISGQLTYALLNPQAGTYTIGVAPTNSSGRFSLAATTATPLSNQPTQRCSSLSCTATYPLISSGDGIVLGARSGDQVLFPIQIGASGRIEVRATWTGTASILSLSLDGPDQQTYRRLSGRSPLTLTYDVTSTDFRRGQGWQASLVNANSQGGSAEGQVVITYPR